MAAVLFILVVAAVLALTVRYGADSRIHDLSGRHRPEL
jgi:hypothetical protein